MDIMDSMERKEAYQDYYDDREARLKKLGLTIEKWQPKEDQAAEGQVDDYYQTVGRLKSRLEATRSQLEGLSEAREDEGLRARIDQAITELEEAVAQAAPRFQ